jgi:hypothetical protein
MVSLVVSGDHQLPGPPPAGACWSTAAGAAGGLRLRLRLRALHAGAGTRGQGEPLSHTRWEAMAVSQAPWGCVRV